ncbi:DUF4157 domain-containing protein [Nocardioides dongxiaopingii]|uniref:eCIS core domain-containing protein n=1 Tax=Nocardioides dongxiaopingii TaxID=2576036 RepID=UPI0010C76671|nr:DUF4157 domain-containing protein [Nocardioides dongxiaopingii]
MPDHDAPTKADHQTLERVPVTAAEPVRRVMTVGAADDHAERDADRRADDALGWLASQQPLDRQAAEPHVHTAACGIARSHAPQPGAATIGYEGGDLDAGTQGEIESSVGGGESLEAPVRSTMEAAFGTDLGKVRIHRGASAAKISRTISAEAFTTGNDIFFAGGAYDPSSARGQKVLAHELGHVMQGKGSVHRLFGKKTDAEKQQAAADKAKKEAEKARKAEEEKAKKEEVARQKAAEQERKGAVKGARTMNKAVDKSVRATAEGVNAQHADLSKRIKLSYQASPHAKLLAPTDLVTLQSEFQRFLEAEAAARQAVVQQATGGVGTEDQGAMAEKLADQAAENVWRKAPPDIRALRPLRFDEFDKALNEVNALAAEGRAQVQGQSSKALVDNEAGFGAPMDPGAASKQVMEQRALERKKRRALGDETSAASIKHEVKSVDRGDAAVDKANAQHHVGHDRGDQLRAKAAEGHDVEKFGEDETLEDVRDGFKTGGKVLGGLMSATKSTTGGVVSAGLSQKNDGTDISELVGRSGSGLSELLTLVSDILGFASQVREIKQGTADKGAAVKATAQFVTVLGDATKVTKTSLLAIKEGVEAFGPAGSAILGQVGTGLPIVGLISTSLGLIEGTLSLLPTLDRHTVGVLSVEEALLAGRAPLAASYDRVNSRTAQLIEKSVFGLAKDVTMLGLHIAEIASAGGFAIPAAAKLTLTIVDLLHSAGHKIYDTVGEQKSSKALTAFKVKHEEGASRDVLKYDIGSSVDVIIVAAKKHKLDYARMTLNEYGVTDGEIDSMWLDELREKVLDGLDAEGNPKTVSEKIDAAKDSVKEALGIEKKPAGPKEETTLLQDVAAVPKAIGGAIAGLPGMIKKKYQSMKQAYADAEQLVAAKNSVDYGGKKERGGGSTMYYAMRDGKKNEKSLANVRKIMAGDGVVPSDLPRTTEDRRKRAEVLAKKDAGPDANISGPISLDLAFVAQVVKATSAELFTLIQQVDQTAPISPVEMAKLRFLEMEVAARINQPGATAMPGARR